MLGNRVWKVTEKELCSTVAQYASAAAGHVHQSNASIHSRYILRKEWSPCWGKSEIVIAFCFQRQFPLATVTFVSKEVIDWSPNLQINILSEFIFFPCVVSNVKRTQLIWLMDGSKCSPGPKGGLQEKCTVPYNTHKNAHINIPSRWVPPCEQQGPLCGCICVCSHACMHILSMSPEQSQSQEWCFGNFFCLMAFQN